MDQKPRDQFDAHWTLNWTLLHIWKNFLSGGKMSVFKGLGSNLRIQYQKYVIDMWEDWINLWSFFSFLKKNTWFFLFYCFHFHFVHLDWKGWKHTLSSNHLARIHKTNHVNSKIDQKMGELLCFQQCPQSIDVSSILIWAMKVKE
jgi:hypothetical protein